MSASRPSSRRVVLLGHPVAHSLSAVFQNAAIAAAGIAARYEAVDVAPAAFAAVFASMRETDAAGNVTVPHKSAAYAACDVRTAVAERVGAVNTFWVEGGRIIGDNTDVAGVRAALAAFGETRLNGARIALLSGPAVPLRRCSKRCGATACRFACGAAPHVAVTRCARGSLKWISLRPPISKRRATVLT
ncbi:MAG: hypothetical protein ACKOFO_03635 [Gemmatimonadota bacterium]